MRDIKLRFWDKDRSKYNYFTLGNIATYGDIFQKHIINGDEPEQFTDKKDNKETEIFQGDTLKISVRAFTGFKRLAGKETPQYEEKHIIKNVEWDDENLTYCLDGNLLTEFDSANIEIIGNINR